MQVDRKAPEIIFVQSVLQYNYNMSTDDLQTLTVENIHFLTDMEKVNIMFVARDHKNNIAKKNLMIPWEEELEGTEISLITEVLEASKEPDVKSEEEIQTPP